MAKSGMKRPDPSDNSGSDSRRKKRSKKAYVPELQGKAKFTKEKAGPL